MVIGIPRSAKESWSGKFRQVHKWENCSTMTPRRINMSKRPRRNHAPAFKAKVALEAIKGEQTLVELSLRYQVHPNQITEWKNRLLENAPDIFNRSQKAETGPDLKDLHAKIGQLAMENDFLSHAL
jgi:transposase